MPSATLAESKLSTPPSSVKENAAGKISKRSDSVIDGKRGAGKPCGMPPKWLPIVSMGRRSNRAATEADTTVKSIPGQGGRQHCRKKISAADPAPMQNAAKLTVGSA